MDPLISLHPSFGWIVALALFLTVLVTAWKAVGVPLLRGIHKAGKFLDDWYGTADGKPPVPERIETMETSLLDVQDQMKAVLEQLAEVHEQTHTNGGASLKDIATRTESRVVSLEHNLSDHFDDAKHRDERLAAIERDHHANHHNEEST